MNQNTQHQASSKAGHTASNSSSGWENYWQGPEAGAALIDHNLAEQLLKPLWQEFFIQQLAVVDEPQVLEVACGNGYVTNMAARFFDKHSSGHLLCLDISPAAIAAIEKNFPVVGGMVGDAANLPISDGEIDMLYSQFGLEYAGAQAFEEAIRVLSERGELMLICHCVESAIYRECATNLSILDNFSDSEILPLARQAFRQGYGILSGKATRSDFLEADKRLAPAVESVKLSLKEHPDCAAVRSLKLIYVDLGKMYSQIEAYDEAEVNLWFDRNAAEVNAYRQRMASMLEAAADEHQRDSFAQRLKEKGLKVSQNELLYAGDHKRPIAWLIKASRRTG